MFCICNTVSVVLQYSFNVNDILLARIMFVYDNQQQKFKETCNE